MIRATEQFSMDLPVSEARAACRNAVGGFGWDVATAETDRFDLELAARGTHNRQNISILIQPASDDETTIVLDGKIGGIGPIQKRHLSRSISRIREAIASSTPGMGR